MMRTYIFSETERKHLLRWLKSGGRDPSINYIISRMEKNRGTLLSDFKLLVAAIKKYNAGY